MKNEKKSGGEFVYTVIESNYCSFLKEIKPPNQITAPLLEKFNQYLISLFHIKNYSDGKKEI